MPIVFGLFGIVLIVSGVRGTITGSNPNLISLIKSDLTGQPNYTEWMIAILAIGALGYIEEFRPLSRAFMALVIVVLLLSNKGFFAQLEKQAVSTDSNVAQPSTQSAASSNPLTSALHSLPSDSQIFDYFGIK